MDGGQIRLGRIRHWYFDRLNLAINLLSLGTQVFQPASRVRRPPDHDIRQRVDNPLESRLGSDKSKTSLENTVQEFEHVLAVWREFINGFRVVGGVESS